MKKYVKYKLKKISKLPKAKQWEAMVELKDELKRKGKKDIIEECILENIWDIKNR